MKAPQERTTDIRIDKYTVVDGMSDASKSDSNNFRVLTKSADRGSNYADFVWIETLDGAEAFRDVLQYILSAMDADVDVPDRYKNYTPLGERERAFSETNSDWDNSHHGDDCKLRVRMETQYVAFESQTEYGSPPPIHFHSSEEVETLIDALDAWIAFEKAEE